MALSNDIIKAFSKLTDNKIEDTGTSVKGTFKVINGKEYVQLDGSEILTPVITSVEAVPDERVMVLIKDHIAKVTENITSPAARNKSVEDLKDEVDEQGNTIQQMDNTIIQQNNSIIQMNNSINQQNTSINQIDTKVNQQGDTIVSLENTIVLQNNNISQMNNAIVEHGNTIDSMNNTITEHGNNINTMNNTITQHGNAIIQNGNTITQQGNQITEQNSKITIINSAFSIVDGVLTGLSEAVITSLKTGTFDAAYADIDFSNIGVAAIQNLFTDSGIINNLVVDQGHITGELVGVTIKGDLIEGNTIKADKLVIKGSDGLYYKLNINGETIESEQTNDNSLNGSIITAKTITASKVMVEDLVAFGATIGGFVIGENSIHSIEKSSMNSDIEGLYFDKDGQFYLGDDTDHIKYYKNTDNEYVLDIRANNIFMGASNVDINTQLSKIGGSNIFSNPVCYFYDYNTNIADNWTGKALSFTNTEIKNKTISGNSFMLQNSTLEQTIQIPNGVYTVSFIYKKLISLSSCKVIINNKEILLDSIDWKEEYLTFEVKSNSINIKIISDTDNSCLFSDLIGSIGTLVKVWSNNPSESVKGGVKIGNGIEVTSTTSNIKQKIDNDGNRIINTNTQEVVSEFTDKGMTTKEAEIDKGQIAKVLQVDMGDQTWFSRL